MDKEWVIQSLMYEHNCLPENSELEALTEEIYKPHSPEREIELDSRIYEIRKILAEQIYEKTFSSIMDKGSVAYTLNYGDHTNLGSHLDHGDVFQNIPHVRINEH
jgi:hypothetical protein